MVLKVASNHNLTKLRIDCYNTFSFLSPLIDIMRAKNSYTKNHIGPYWHQSGNRWIQHSHSCKILSVVGRRHRFIITGSQRSERTRIQRGKERTNTFKAGIFNLKPSGLWSCTRRPVPCKSDHWAVTEAFRKCRLENCLLKMFRHVQVSVVFKLSDASSFI